MSAKNVSACHTKICIETSEKVIGLFWLLINMMKSMPGITIIFQEITCRIVPLRVVGTRPIPS